MRVPTIKIKADTPGGHVIINQSDFDPQVHEEYVEPEQSEQAEEPVSIPGPSEPSPPSPQPVADGADIRQLIMTSDTEDQIRALADAYGLKLDARYKRLDSMQDALLAQLE